MRGTSYKRRHAADEGSHVADCWNRKAGDGLPGKIGTCCHKDRGDSEVWKGGAWSYGVLRGKHWSFWGTREGGEKRNLKEKKRKKKNGRSFSKIIREEQGGIAQVWSFRTLGFSAFVSFCFIFSRTLPLPDIRMLALII